MKNSIKKSTYAKGFLTMIKNTYDRETAEDICRLANEYSDTFINDHPDAYGSAVKVSYPFAGIYKALQKYETKEKALQMMKDYAPTIGQNVRKKFWRFTSLPGVPFLIWANMERIMKIAGSEKAGYKSKILGVKGNKAGLDILSCPVVNALVEIGCPEVAPVMCAIDQIYGTGYRGIRFKRTRSLADGDDCCDYRYARIK